MEQTFMKEKPVLPLVLSMSLPMVLSMLTNSLYNIIDSYFVAKISEEAMTAISLVFPPAAAGKFRRCRLWYRYQRRSRLFPRRAAARKANDATSAGLLLSLFHGIALTALCVTVIPHFLRLFTDTSAILEYGLDYSYIVFSFAPVITVGTPLKRCIRQRAK